MRLMFAYSYSINMVDVSFRRKRSIFIFNSPSDDQNESSKTTSLLSLRYKIVNPFAIIVYVVLQLIIGFNYIPVQAHTDHEIILSLKVMSVTFGAGLAFAISVIQQIMKIRECRQVESHGDLQGVYYSILTVSSISASSYFLTYILNWGGVMQDVLGVYSCAAQWGEWLVTVPLMIYIALAIENKAHLTREDTIILLIFIIAILFGFLLNIDGIPLEVGYLLFALACCSLTVKVVTDIFHKVAPELPSDYDYLFTASKKKVLFRLFIFIFPLYPLTHVLAQCKVLDMDMTMIAYCMLSVISKLLFGSYLSQTYVNIGETLDKLEQGIRQKAQGDIAQIKSEYDIDLLRVSSENDKILREAECEQLRSLMGNVAHDLKTPLHSIVADIEALSMLLSKFPLHDLRMAESKIKCHPDSRFDSKSVFNSLNATSQFMAMAINRSQDFMKASNDIALVPAMETFELQSALMMPLTCMRHLKAERSIVVHPLNVDICPHLISDKHWLSENVLCLLSNAVKYSDDGAVDLRITLIDNGDLTGEQSLNQMVLVSVEDTGIGISEDKRNNLFQPFMQAQRHAGGTGLGLYSLSKRIEALGGAAGVKSRSDGNQGSIFWFTFPYRPCSDMSTVFNEQEIDVTASPSSRHILLVDDSISILKVTSRLLTMNGHTVETALNGSIGLARLKNAYADQDIDMVITDLQMPVMDGIEETSRFRKFEDQQNKLRGESRRLLIVGVSASNDTQSKNDGLNSGMDFFLFKPFSYKDLVHILQNEPHLSKATKSDVDSKSDNTVSIRKSSFVKVNSLTSFHTSPLSNFETSGYSREAFAPLSENFSDDDA